MRDFFYKLVKNISFVYMCSMLVLSYRLVYNEYFFEINDEVEASISEGQTVYPSGKIVGIYTECDGVFVIDTSEIESEDGEFINPAAGKIKTGDYILAINGESLDTKEDLVNAVSDSEGSTLELTVCRNDETFTTDITPILAKNGKYMLGLWVKDDLAGVGTITYYTTDGDFAALGHGMGDGETNDLLEVKGGDIYVSNIIGIQKGEKGTPGEVKGVIYYGRANHLGELSGNSGEGIYGTLDNEDFNRYVQEAEAYEAAPKQEIEAGPAQILSDVSGQLKAYDIEITYVDYLALNSNKGLHIEVTDPELLELTGGIVQGMSGSPIIQDGKLVGAVTHVLVNDPTRGYGIFIENMLDAAK